MREGPGAVSELKHRPPAVEDAKRAMHQALLDHVLEPMRRVARDAGYAITVHGSLVQDIDLVAIPWIETAKTPDYLVDRLAAVVASIVGRCNLYRTGTDRWADKPHGRRATTLLVYAHLDMHTQIDLSVVTPHRGKDNDDAAD